MEQTQQNMTVEENQGDARRTVTIIGIAVLALILAIGIPVVLYLLGDSESSALEKLRDVTIVFIGFLWIIIVLLIGAAVATIVWIAFQIKNRVVPLLEEILANVRDTSDEVTATAKRARGTAEFVSDKVASPIISTLGTVTRLRKTATMFVVDKDKKPPSSRGKS